MRKKCYICKKKKEPRYFVDINGKTYYYCQDCVDKYPNSDEGLMEHWERKGYELGEYDDSMVDSYENGLRKLKNSRIRRW